MATSITTEGTIIRDARDRYRRRGEDGAKGAFDAEVRRIGSVPRTEVAVKRAAAPARVAGLLGIDSATEAAVRDRKMYAGERRVQLAVTYVPVDVAEAAGIEQVDTGVGGIISRMREAGFEQDDAYEELRQVEVGAEEAELLGVPAGTSLIEITHVASSGDRVVEVTVHTLGPGWVLKYGVPLA
ncbi:UTRA domain-containing protein [Kitasatospora aureofaciens]|uniref:UTRA domain-containing protein n=1 Tax=Kitasatospora aureofaciens TaxID=1894 RepID=UPI001C44AF0A|nr:UTRA domain-containing protein [Kitasatospora aureofaciens]MBV6700281.1 UTRA domain-containing protein [Kitasatospora aureofaciens]